MGTELWSVLSYKDIETTVKFYEGHTYILNHPFKRLNMDIYTHTHVCRIL